jgi:hypothetical protein
MESRKPDNENFEKGGENYLRARIFPRVSPGKAGIPLPLARTLTRTLGDAVSCEGNYVVQA